MSTSAEATCHSDVLDEAQLFFISLDTQVLIEYYREHPSLSTLENVMGVIRRQESERRREIAENDQTPASIIAELSHDEDSSVRAAAAGNEYCPLEDLRRLIYDSSWMVWLHVLENPNCPEAEEMRRPGDWNH